MHKLKSKWSLLFILVAIIGGYFSINLVIESSTNKLHEKVIIEAGEMIPDETAFIIEDKYTGTFVTDLETIDTNVPGSYTILIEVKRRELSTILEVVDTIAPTAEPVDHEIWVGEEVALENFVANINDITPVSTAFEEIPDFSVAGTFPINIVLEDTSGNQTIVTSSLTIVADTEAPVITGVVSQEIYAGETLSYKRGVSVTDNRDEDVELVIDSQLVNQKEAGTYPVTYSAIDSSGNKTLTSVAIIVKEMPDDYVTDEEIYALVDEALADLDIEDMSDYEKLETIFYWVNGHIAYTGYSDKSDYMLEAYRGIENASGDCFTYFAVAKVMLNRIGFETIDVERVVNNRRGSKHYWSLVLYEGEWYHYDPCLYPTGYPYFCLLKTDEEVFEYSELCLDYFAFDTTLYPATPTEPLEINS